MVEADADAEPPPRGIPPAPSHVGAMLNAATLDVLRLRTPTVLVDVVNGCEVWAKLEYQHPSGSTKDRVAAAVLGAAVADGSVTASTRVAEASSGSMSVSLAMGCSLLGVSFTAVMPENVTAERALMIRRLGGDVVLTSAADGMAGALAALHAMAAAPDVFVPMQFENPRNVEAHATTTAVELVHQVSSPIDAFVAGVGTGGTLAGVGAGLRRAHGRVEVVEARPVAPDGAFSCAVPGVVAGYSRLLGGDATPTSTVDVPEAEALATARRLARRGLPVGPSSGLNIAAARSVAERLGPGHVVATVLPDRMERYFSSELFADLSAAA